MQLFNFHHTMKETLLNNFHISWFNEPEPHYFTQLIMTAFTKQFNIYIELTAATKLTKDLEKYHFIS